MHKAVKHASKISNTTGQTPELQKLQPDVSPLSGKVNTHSTLTPLKRSASDTKLSVRRASTSTMSTQMNTPSVNVKERQKLLLKKKFVSFEYHEKLLETHKMWVNTLRTALKRAEEDMSPNTPTSGYQTIAEEAKAFRKKLWPLIEQNDNVGQYQKESWSEQHATATFRSICDYGRQLFSEGDMLAWINTDERAELAKHWQPMAEAANNIRNTVDEVWDADPNDNDWILEKKYSGNLDGTA
jgi:LAS superfamily LD-carboxypeptidase LdcB